MPGSIPVVLNALSGRGHADDELAKLAELFRAAGAEAEIHLAKTGAEIVDLVKNLSRENPERIIAGGGDGTMNTLASVLAGTQTALGILPLGTLNHFARDLHIPLELPEAVRTAVTGRKTRIDVGEVNGRVFVNNSSIGLYPAMVLHRENQRRRLGRSKWHAMFWAALNVLRRHPFLQLRLVLDGKPRELRTPFVFIGNNEYVMEGFNIGARERLDAGHLSVYVTLRGRRGLLLLALRALLGLLHRAKDFESATAHSLRIETRHKRVLVATDGEVTALPTPLDYRIRPRDLLVIVP